MLVEALLRLLENKNISKITISELTKEAGLVRNTFYAHFDKIEDILIYDIFEKYKTYLEAELETGNREDLDYDYMYFKFWADNKPLLKIISDNDIIHIIAKAGDYISAVCDDYNLSENCEVSELASPFVDNFFADTLASILRKWIELGMTHSAEELNRIYKELTIGRNG